MAFSISAGTSDTRGFTVTDYTLIISKIQAAASGKEDGMLLLSGGWEVQSKVRLTFKRRNREIIVCSVLLTIDSDYKICYNITSESHKTWSFWQMRT